MKTKFAAATLMGLAALGASATAGAASNTLSGAIASFGDMVNAIPVPVAGTLGSAGLATLDHIPGIAPIQLPLLGTGFGSVPFLGIIPISQGFTIFESIAPLQGDLAGLNLISGGFPILGAGIPQ